jgi:ubiquinone/menaquinone biosynthesis C-methylase UbiE
VADVGAGDGFFTVRLAWLLGSAGRVYAVDIDEKTLSGLGERVRAAPFDKVELVLGQADDPKLPVATLDAVLIVNSYHEMPEHQRMLERIHEALKPEGRPVLVEPFSAGRRALPREEQEKKH